MEVIPLVTPLKDSNSPENKKFPKLAKSAYFVTRSEISEDNLGSLKEYISTSATLVNLPDYCRKEQIAVVIKLRIEDASGYGYIVLDPEMPMDNPAVFRLDSRVTTRQVAYDKVSFKFVEPLNKHLVESQFITAFVKSRSNNPPAVYLYDFKRPYCTFVETTMKPNLLAFTHSKELLDNIGVSYAKLIANIQHSSKGQSIYNVKFLFHYEDSNTTTVTIPHMKNILKEINSNTIKPDLLKFCDRSGIDRKDCLDSMTKEIVLLQEIYKDKEFLQQCQQVLWSPPVPCVDEENSSGAVLRALDPAATKKSSFKMPLRNMVWKHLEKLNAKARCESYGYGSKK